MLVYLNDRTCVRLLDGKLVVDLYFWKFGKDGGNPFREAAEFVERHTVIEDYDPPAENSLREIRRAVSDGGPVYLSTCPTMSVFRAARRRYHNSAASSSGAGSCSYARN